MMRFINFLKYGAVWGIIGIVLCAIFLHCFTVFAKPNSYLLDDDNILFPATLFGMFIGFAGAMYGAVFTVSSNNPIPDKNYTHKKKLVLTALTLAFLGVIVKECGIKPADFTERGAILNMQDPAYVDEEHVIAQVCEPNKIVAFEEVKIDLAGTAPPLTLQEVRTGTRQQALAPDSSVLSSPNQGNKPIVRRWIQISEPKGVTDFTYGISGVRDTNHGHSIHVSSFGGIGGMFLLGNTEKKQPVYENGTEEGGGARSQDTIAYEIMTGKPSDNPKDRLIYWYQLPKEVPHDKFTPWLEPVSQETLEIENGQRFFTWQKLGKGMSVEHYPVIPGAPKMRFRIMSIREHYDSYRFWNQELEAIRKKYYPDWKGIVEPRTTFDPVLSETIPGCDNGKKLTKDDTQYW